MPSTPIVSPAPPELPPIPSRRLSRADLADMMQAGREDGFAPEVVDWSLGIDDAPKRVFITALHAEGAEFNDFRGCEGFARLRAEEDVHEVSLYSGGVFWPIEDLDALKAWHAAHNRTLRNLLLSQDQFRRQQRSRPQAIRHWPFTLEPHLVAQVHAWREQAVAWFVQVDADDTKDLLRLRVTAGEMTKGWAELSEDVAAMAVVMELLDAIAAGLRFVNLTTHAPVRTHHDVALALYANDILGFLGSWDDDPMRKYPLFGMRGVVNLPRGGVGNLPGRAVRLLPVQVWHTDAGVAEVHSKAAFSFQDLRPGDLVAPVLHRPSDPVARAIEDAQPFCLRAQRVVQTWHASNGPGRHRIALRDLPLCEMPRTREGMLWQHGSTEVLVGYCSAHGGWEVEVCDVREQWPDRLLTAFVHDEHEVNDPGSSAVLHVVAVAVLRLPEVQAVRRDDPASGELYPAMVDGNLYDPLLRRHGPREPELAPAPREGLFATIMLSDVVPTP